MNYSTDFKSVRDSVSAEEWQTRCDLAACYRLMDCFAMMLPSTSILTRLDAVISL